MLSRAGILILCLALAQAIGRAGDGDKPPSAPKKDDYERDIAPLIAKYCVTCHGPNKPKASLNLARYNGEAGLLRDRKICEKVLKRVHASEMPPRRKPQPTPAERQQIVTWLEGKLYAVDCELKRDPGRVTIRRLNRTEYNNTIRGLVGVRFQPAEDFPSDDVGYG